MMVKENVVLEGMHFKDTVRLLCFSRILLPPLLQHNIHNIRIVLNHRAFIRGTLAVYILLDLSFVSKRCVSWGMFVKSA